MPFVALEHGVDVLSLYPSVNKNYKTEWECGDCEENLRK